MRESSSNVATIRRDDGFWRSAYRDHAPAVLGFLMRRLRQRDTAEDLLQETFVRAMRVDSFDGGNLRGYLISIARNLMINRLRRPRLVVPVETPDPESQPFAEVAADNLSPEQETSGRMLQARIHLSLGGLTDDHRTAFELAVMKQYTYAEVAESTGWSLPRVKSNVYRARKKLIDALADFMPDSEVPR